MPLSELAPGHVLDGKYRLAQRIGRGGFGDVWRAVELLPGGAPLRDVALKLLAPQFDDSTWAEEAKLLASLSHASLVTIYQAGILEDVGAPFVAMELLIGETLADKLRRRGRLPWRAALRFARDVAAALDVIHDRGVVHLDLKPANLFVTATGEVKVLDFGISRSAHGAIPRSRSAAAALALSATVAAARESSDPFAATQIASSADAPSDGGRVVVGTPGFVAPEVLASGEATRLADAYALGVTIAQLMTGALPHAVSVEPPDDSDADTLRAYFVELRQATLDGRLRDLEAAGLPRGVAALVDRLCAVDPSVRDVPSLFALVDDVWARPEGVPSMPYPGAAPFGVEHEGLLFGRDAEIARVVRHLAVESVVVVAGAYGSGKTSFVRAALIPEIAKQGLDGRLDYRIGYAALDDEPDRALDAALTPLNAQPFDGDDEPGADFARVAGLSTGDDVGHVVVLDDLERLLGAEPEARARTVRFLADALASRLVEGVRVVLVADVDAVDALASLDASLASLPGVVRYLAPPPDAAAKDIATGAARAAGWALSTSESAETAVAGELARGGTPLVAIAIALAARADPKTRTLADAPTTATALHRHAAAVFDAFPSEDRDLATELLLQLSTSEGAPITRSMDEVARLIGEHGPRADTIIDRLRSGHVITTTRDGVRLGHPAFSSWPHLTSARLHAMDRLALRERLGEAADAWERSARDPDYLDRGALAAALRRQGPAALRGLRAIEHELLDASRRARRRSLAWRIAAAAAVAIVMVAVLAGKRALDERRVAAEAAERDATRRAAVTELVSRARGAADPYQRVAYLTEAMRLGADDPALPMELLGASFELAPARFLTLDAVERPAMPWDSRWVVGIGAAGAFVVIDLEPTVSEPEVLEHVDMDIDEKRLNLLYRRPVVTTLSVGAAPVVDVVPFAFDTAALARNADGEVHLLRLRDNGDVALAAVLPMKCRGGLVAAARAPVAACVSDGGLSIWDARREGAVEIDQPAGALSVSPDGARVAAWTGAEVVVVQPFAETPTRTVVKAPSDVRVAAFGPREPLLALGLGGRLVVIDLSLPEAPLVDVPALADPADIRWDESGTDVTLCKLSGQPVHYYLREGGRPPGDARPSGRCDRHRPEAPRLVSRFALGVFASKSSGAHFSRAFELDGGRVLSTSLALAVTDDDRLDQKLLFLPRDEERRPLDAAGSRSIARVVRLGGVAVVERSHRPEELLAHQAPEIVVAESGSGRRLQATRGHLLGPCPDGRIVAWRVDGELWTVFEVRSGAVLGKARRAPGLVVGVGPSCTKLYTQRLDGTIDATDLNGEVIAASRAIASASGYVFDTEASAAAAGLGAGLVVALSSGEVARIDEADDTVRLLARASPRATALAEGAAAGETLFADGLGLWRVGQGGSPQRIVSAPPGAPWEDVLPIHGGAAVVLASVEELSVVDVAAGAVVGSAPIRGRTKLIPWGDSGSLLAYAPDVEGIPFGVVLPFGQDSVEAIGALASNLRVSPTGALELKR